MNRPVAIAAVVLVLVVGATWWYMSGGDGEDLDAVAPAPVVEAPPVAEPPPLTPLPALEDSDSMARELAQSSGMLGAVAAGLLEQEELIRRFVRVADAIAGGSSPASDLSALGPDRPFAVTETADQIFMDPASYGRYDGVGEAIARIDAEAAVASYRLLEPLADQVYSEMVGEERAFRPVLLRALAALLAVPVVGDAPELVDAINRYRYADESLESLSLPQKHLLRMGPANIDRIQARLRQIARLLG